jgi:hypothetical protein
MVGHLLSGHRAGPVVDRVQPGAAAGGSRVVRARARLARRPLRRDPVPELVGEIGMPEWQRVWREAFP